MVYNPDVPRQRRLGCLQIVGKYDVLEMSDTDNSFDLVQ